MGHASEASGTGIPRGAPEQGWRISWSDHINGWFPVRNYGWTLPADQSPLAGLPGRVIRRLAPEGEDT